jgi:hypothetical protein
MSITEAIRHSSTEKLSLLILKIIGDLEPTLRQTANTFQFIEC